MRFEETFEKAAKFNVNLQNDSTAGSFQPPGELLESYTSKGRKFIKYEWSDIPLFQHLGLTIDRLAAPALTRMVPQ